MSAERANASASSARISGVSPDTARRSAAHHACAGPARVHSRSVDPNPTQPFPTPETAPSPESPNAFATAARPRFATPASAHADVLSRSAAATPAPSSAARHGGGGGEGAP